MSDETDNTYTEHVTQTWKKKKKKRCIFNNIEQMFKGVLKRFCPGNKLYKNKIKTKMLLQPVL